MDEHLEAWQIAKHILGGPDEDELEDVDGHRAECAGWFGRRPSSGEAI